MLKYIHFFILIIFVFTSCSESGIKDPIIVKHGKGDKAMVVTAHPLASKAGLDIIKKGGNVVDAAVAVQFALAVVYPRAGNIGGGGFMVYRDASGATNTLDFREKAPLGATRDMYLDAKGNAISKKSRYGGLAIGIPGVVDGMVTAQSKLGSIKSFGTLLQPAIDLAEKGFYLTQEEADRFNKYKAEFQEWNKESFIFVKDELWKSGDLFRQPKLAQTLKTIQKEGRDGFYKGKVAADLIQEVNKSGGIFTQKDLDKYHSKWRKPITFKYKDYTITSMGPPSSGGIALAQILGMMEPYDLSKMPFQGKDHVHLMVEAERRAFSDRAKYLGDSDFYPVPIDSLINKNYLAQRMRNISINATPSTEVEHKNFMINKESMETTHYSIVDTLGNALSITTTLNANFGSKVYNKAGGYFLNNEMDDFSAKPGTPNMYGLIGGEANAIYPEKRMLSSMTPTIITKNGQLYMVVGTPGGSTIITSVAQVFLNTSSFGMNISEAVDANRFHHQWLPDLIYQEPGTFDKEVMKELNELGYKFGEFKKIGDVDAILMDKNGHLEGGADRRGISHAAAW